MKDIIISREGIEKVESKTKEAEYDAKVDNEDSLSTKSEKRLLQRNIVKDQR